MALTLYEQVLQALKAHPGAAIKCVGSTGEGHATRRRFQVVTAADVKVGPLVTLVIVKGLERSKKIKPMGPARLTWVAR